MSKPLTSSLRKSAIDIDFYNQLIDDRTKQLADSQPEMTAQVQWPELRVTNYFGAVLPIIESTNLPVKAHTPPRLKRHPGIETMPLPHSRRGNGLNEIEERESLPNGYSSVDLVLPALPDDERGDIRNVTDGASHSPSPHR